MAKRERVQWYDLQKVTYDDLETESDYMMGRSEDAAYKLSGNGVVGRDSLITTFGLNDSILSEIPSTDTIANYETIRPVAADLYSAGDTEYKMLAQKFQAIADNLQGVKLYMEADAGWAGILQVEIRELVAPTDPTSAPDLGGAPLAQSTLGPSDLTYTFGGSTLSSSSVVELDFSTGSYGDEVSALSSLTVGSYYAIVVYRFGSPASQSGNIYVGYNLSSDFNYGNKSVGTDTVWANTLDQSFYFQIFMAAIEVEPGIAYIKGQPVELDTSVFMSLKNLVGTPHYLVLRYSTVTTSPVSHPRTGNSIYSRAQDSYSLTLYTWAEWSAIASASTYDNSTMLLLSIVNYYGYANANNRIVDTRFFIPYSYNGGMIDLPQTIPCIDKTGSSLVGDVVKLTSGSVSLEAEGVPTYAPNNLRETKLSTIVERINPGTTVGNQRLIGVVVGKLTLYDLEGNAVAGRMVAYSGRARVNVETQSRSIAAGDLLVPSEAGDTSIYFYGCVKAADYAYASSIQPGTVIGKALQPLASATPFYSRIEISGEQQFEELGTGGLDVLVNLQ